VSTAQPVVHQTVSQEVQWPGMLNAARDASDDLSGLVIFMLECLFCWWINFDHLISIDWRPRLWHLPTLLWSIISSLPWRGGGSCVTKGVKRYAEATLYYQKIEACIDILNFTSCSQMRHLYWEDGLADGFYCSRRCWISSTATAQHAA